MNLTLLREAAGLFEGGHDFAAFANNPRDKVRMYVSIHLFIYLWTHTCPSIYLLFAAFANNPRDKVRMYVHVSISR